MTQRLYYDNPELMEFSATVVDTGVRDDRFYTVLDRSAFYPTSGGQLFDTGLLNDKRVIDVIEDGEDRVLHITAEPAAAAGDTVRGIVDARRRNLHRQQHTAQHIISQAFVELCGFATVSVHLGEEYGAVELDTEDISPDQIRQAEEYSAQVMFADYPVEIRFVEREEALRLPLRKVPEREGKIRVVAIGEFDYSACGGTHCRSTAQVGILKVMGTEKMRGHVLVKFLAGEQARSDYSRRLQITDELSSQFTCHCNDLLEKTAKLAEENKLVRRELGRLQKEMLPSRADSLAESNREVAGYRLVTAGLGEYDPKLAGELSGLVAERVGGLAVLLTGDRMFVAAAPGSGLHAGQLVKLLSERTGLRGGGGESRAQVGGTEAALLEEYAGHFEAILNEM